ncbi:MAG: hypothetical protein ACREQ5_24270 [Candidatus Dormibacteria bacterium]
MKDETKDVPGKSQSEEPAKQSISDMEAEIKAAELELKRLALKNAQLAAEKAEAEIQDLREQLDERKLKRQAKGDRARGQGANLKQDRLKKNASQNSCNHRKGGDGAAGVVGGKGTDAQYSVMKHVFANGDTWVRCLRCGKTWKPPLRKRFATDDAYQKAVEKYTEAVYFPTRNHTSSSQQFQWGFTPDGKQGGKEFYREVMENVSLE